MALARSVSVKLKAEVAEYVAGLNKAAGATKEFKDELGQAAKKGNLDAVASASMGMGLALSGAFGLAATAAAKFDRQMSEVGAVANANAGQLDLLRDAALRAGKDTSFSATEAAKAQAELAKAGLSSSEILGGALTGSLALAAAGGLDLAEAADIAAKNMNVFKLNSGDVGHIADVLAASANKSATDVHEMGEALRQGGLVAADTGLTLEDTVGTLSAFADRALVGSDAGTSLKTMLQMLANPSKEAAATMRQLGINAYDAQGNFVGITGLAGQLQTKLGGLTQAQRDEATAQIFGSDAKRAALVLYNLGEQGLRDYITAVDDEGAAADMAREKTNNLAGDIERLTGSLETLAIESSTGASSGLRTLVQAADNLVGSVSSIPAPVQNAAVIVAGVGGAALLAAAGASKLRDASADALKELANTGPIGQKAAAGLEKTGKAAGRAAIALAAIQAASALMGESVDARMDALGSRMDEFAKSGKLGGEAARVFGDDLGKLDAALSDVADTGRWSSFVRGTTGIVEGLTGLGNDYDLSLQHSRERLDALDQTLAQMVSGGHADEAAAAFARVAERAAEQGVSVNELNKVLPGYAAALDQAKASTDLNALAQQSAAEHTDIMAGSLQEAVEKAGSLKGALDKLNGTMIGWAEAEIAAEAAVDKLTESMAKNGATMDVNTDAGRANKEALLSGIQTARDAAQAKLDESHSLEQANTVYDVYKQKLIDTIATQGGTRQATDQTRAAAKALVDQFGQMPPLVSAKVETPGLPQSRADAAELYRGLQNLDGMVARSTVRVNYVAEGDRLVQQRGRINVNRYGGVHYAASGLVNLDGVAAAWGPGETMYGFREPGTGGEAFIARNAPDGPSLRYADVAAQWHGGRVIADSMLASLTEAVRALSSAGASGNTFAIENFNADAGQSPHRIAEDLWFLTTARGGA